MAFSPIRKRGHRETGPAARNGSSHLAGTPRVPWQASHGPCLLLCTAARREDLQGLLAGRRGAGRFCLGFCLGPVAARAGPGSQRKRWFFCRSSSGRRLDVCERVASTAEIRACGRGIRTISESGAAGSERDDARFGLGTARLSLGQYREARQALTIFWRKRPPIPGYFRPAIGWERCLISWAICQQRDGPSRRSRGRSRPPEARVSVDLSGRHVLRARGSARCQGRLREVDRRLFQGANDRLRPVRPGAIACRCR